MDKERKKIDLEPKTMEEKKMKEAFEQWYHSREFVPHGVMITNLCYLGFKQGVEYIKQRVKAACGFYERYTDRPECLWEEKREYREILREMFVFHKENGEPYFGEDDYGWEIYDKWLFKEAFKCVLEEENE